jgi:broad specificity phosphatase PhoE
MGDLVLTVDLGGIRVRAALVDELLCRSQGHAPLLTHGHLLRALATRWVGLPVAGGRLFELGTGSISTLGWMRELRVVKVWNDRAHLEQAAS